MTDHRIKVLKSCIKRHNKKIKDAETAKAFHLSEAEVNRRSLLRLTAERGLFRGELAELEEK